jgi:hypothetical protein
MVRFVLLAVFSLISLSSCCCLLSNKPDAATQKPSIYDNTHLVSGALTYKTPESWQKEEPTNPMRKEQFAVINKNLDGEAELATYVFPGEVGGVEANLERWKAQFKNDEFKDVLDIRRFNIGHLPVTVFEAKGTYLQALNPADPASEKQEIPGAAMLAAIVELKEQLYFFKMIGDAPIVEAEEKNFDDFLNTLSVDES